MILKSRFLGGDYRRFCQAKAVTTICVSNVDNNYVTEDQIEDIVTV
jgi:hypothetical protein